MALMILSAIIYYFIGVTTLQPITWGLGLLSYAFIIADDIRRGDWFGACFLGSVGVGIFFPRWFARQLNSNFDTVIKPPLH